MIGDERFAEWLAKHTRQSVSRGAILPFMRSCEAYDLVDVFPAVHVPAMVLHRRDDPLVAISHGRWIAEHIPDARLVEASGADHFPFIGDTEELLAEVEGFLVGSRGPVPGRRKLLTVVFTDLAESTRRMAALGDDAWRELLAAHDDMVRGHLQRFAGEEVKHLGDGFLAVFDGPARAIRCALGILEGAARLGLSTRAGIHTGECEVADDDVRGIAVNVGARITDLAGPGEILVSGTVRDLVAGSGIRFADGREVELKGIEGLRTVHPVMTHGAGPDAVRRLAIDSASVWRRDGEYWTLAYDGQVATFRDSKGLRDLARLLAAPRQELHVLDLAAEATAVQGSMSVSDAQQAGVGFATRSSEALIDDRAKAAYRRRLVELQQDIDDADEMGDGERAAKVRAELDAIVDQLSSAYGIGGRARRTPDHVERARKAVTRRIREAVARIDRSHPALARHLNASLRTGTFCSYVPERDVTWVIQADPS
jgi:class 3 adenylate cyclase